MRNTKGCVSPADVTPSWRKWVCPFCSEVPLWLIPCLPLLLTTCRFSSDLFEIRLVLLIVTFKTPRNMKHQNIVSTSMCLWKGRRCIPGLSEMSGCSVCCLWYSRTILGKKVHTHTLKCAYRTVTYNILYTNLHTPTHTHTHACILSNFYFTLSLGASICPQCYLLFNSGELWLSGESWQLI